MKKNLIILCSFACLIGFLTGLLGCDQSANEPATPTIVRKKIRITADQKSGPPQLKPAIASQPAPKPESPGPGQQVSEKPLLARKSAPPAVEPPQKKAPQLPIKPKSDISKIQPSPPGKPAKPGAGQTTVASASLNARTMYNPKGKVNPFEPLFREKQVVAAKSKRKKRIPRTPLEKIDLSQLKLVGIVIASNGNKALVEESSGKGYVIRKGTYIGTNAGKVIEIDNSKVIVAEEYEDVVGNVTLRNKELTLPKPPGEF